MPQFKVISGKELVNILTTKFSFVVKSQKGSHIKLKRNNNTIVIPLHKELDRGTIRSIYKELAKNIDTNQLDLFLLK